MSVVRRALWRHVSTHPLVSPCQGSVSSETLASSQFPALHREAYLARLVVNLIAG